MLFINYYYINIKIPYFYFYIDEIDKNSAQIFILGIFTEQKMGILMYELL